MAIEAARTMLEAAGLTVVLCSDSAGRIVDRLVRPKYNAALRFLDEGLATATDDVPRSIQPSAAHALGDLNVCIHFILALVGATCPG